MNMPKGGGATRSIQYTNRERMIFDADKITKYAAVISDALKTDSLPLSEIGHDLRQIGEMTLSMMERLRAEEASPTTVTNIIDLED
jgi:hypothetical protein